MVWALVKAMAMAIHQVPDMRQCRHAGCFGNAHRQRNETQKGCPTPATSEQDTAMSCRNRRHRCCQRCKPSSQHCQCTSQVQKATTDNHHTRPNSLAICFHHPCTSDQLNALRRRRSVWDPDVSSTVQCTQRTHCPCYNLKCAIALCHRSQEILPNDRELLACNLAQLNQRTCTEFRWHLLFRRECSIALRGRIHPGSPRHK